MVRPRHNLPAQPTSIIGREEDLAAIRQRMLGADVRLLTLTGPVGVGKTRLAVEASAALSETFEHGVCYVDLATTREPGLVAISRALALRRAFDSSLEEMLAQYLGGRHTLLVLDNFEHVHSGRPSSRICLQHAPGSRRW